MVEVTIVVTVAVVVVVVVVVAVVIVVAVVAASKTTSTMLSFLLARFDYATTKLLILPNDPMFLEAKGKDGR